MHVDHHCVYCQLITVKVEFVTEKIKMINKIGKDVAELTVHSVFGDQFIHKNKRMSHVLGGLVWVGKFYFRIF